MYIIFSALKGIFEQNELTSSQKISVISKGDRNLLKKNYRPVSLTNTDHKCIAFVLAERLQSILSKVRNKN